MLSIAQYGYDGVPVTLVDAFGRHTADTPYAFFPGYPAAIAAVGVLTGGNSSSPRCSSPPWPAWWRPTGWSGSPS